MSMRDQIARIIFRSGQSCDFQQDTIFAADAIMRLLPELIAHSARIAELEAALKTILQIPNSDAAQGIMKAFAEDALGEKA